MTVITEHVRADGVRLLTASGVRSLLSLALVVLLQGACAQQVPLSDRTAANPESLTGKAQRAKQQGKKALIIEGDSALTGNFIEYRDLREAMANHIRAVVVRLEDQYSVLHGDRNVGTWCKFRVLSALSPPVVDPSVPLLATYPEESRPMRFLPLPSGYVLVSQPGGTLSIDGVEVVETDRAFPAFRPGETYLLFLAVSAENVGGVALGLDGAYLVSGPDALVPRRKTGSRIQKEIQALSGGSLSQLRGALRTGGYGL